MKLGEIYRKAIEVGMAREYGVNILDIPHNSNDNYGINRMLDELQTLGPLKVYEAGDFLRVERGRQVTA